MPRRSRLALLALSLLLLIPILALADNHLSLVKAARAQIGITLFYDSAYQRLPYPNGDVPRERGVCTDVVIRALRDAWQLDLQKLLHEDMRSNFSLYPSLWRMSRPDSNIDHRRVPNLQTLFKRKGWSLPISTNAADYKTGDIVTVTVPPHLPHIMIVSDRKDHSGIPLVIHNIGEGTQEEALLFRYPHTGHYRLTL